MGCGSSVRIHVESSPFSKKLNELPSEILHKIYDELDTITLYGSLYCVSKDFHQTVSNYNRHHLNLNFVSMKNFNAICARIHPENIMELTLTNEESTTGLLEKFLRKFSIDQFSRLRSINLMNIQEEEFVNKILLTLIDKSSDTPLISLRIEESNDNFDDSLNNILTQTLAIPSLRCFSLTLSDIRTSTNPFPFPDHCSITRLIFGTSCSVDFIRQTLVNVGSLKSLEINDLDFDAETNLNQRDMGENDDGMSTDTSVSSEDENLPEQINDDEDRNPEADGNNDVDDHNDDEDDEENEEHESVATISTEKERFLSMPSTDNLTSLTINNLSISMCKTEWFISEMHSLKYLNLSTSDGYDDKRILDGFRWCNLTSNVDTFKFNFTLTLDENTTWNRDRCLKSFRTDFWLNDKRWFVALESSKEEISLHTIPYSKKSYYMKDQFNEIEYKTTAPPNRLKFERTMNSVSTLYINTSIFTETSAKESGDWYFSRISQLWLYGLWSRTISLTDRIASIVDLSTVTEFCREEPLPTIELKKLFACMKNLQSIKTTTDLLDSLNAAKFSCDQCIRTITVENKAYEQSRGVNFEPFCTMFPRVQYLTVPVDTVEACHYIINELKSDLVRVNFQVLSENDVEDFFENEDTTSNDPFDEWLATLPNEYKQHRKQQNIHIWLQ